MAFIVSGLFDVKIPRSIEDAVPDGLLLAHPLNAIGMVYGLALAPQQIKVVLQHLHFRNKNGYDNVHPRIQTKQFVSENMLGLRLQSAHENALENVHSFGIAMLAAYLTGNDVKRLNRLAVIHVVARLLYVVFYAAQQGPAAFAISSLRSSCYMVASLVTVQLLTMSAERAVENDKTKN